MSDAAPTILSMGDHNRQPQSVDHPLQMSGRGAFYSFSFDLGPDVDPIATANKLLKLDMATVAGSPSREGLRVGKRVRLAGRHQREAVRFAEFLTIFRSGNLQWWRMFQLNRKITLRALWVVRGHIVRYIIYRACFGTPKNQSDARDEGISTTETSWDETYKIVEEASTKLTDSLIRTHAEGALRLRIQQQMYFPRYYLQHEPFIRLELNRTLYSDSHHEDEPAEISLMIHRSGVCILTFAIAIAKTIDLSQAYKYLQARQFQFTEINISAPILGSTPRFMNKEYNYWRMAITNDGHINWVRYRTPKDGKEKITLESVFRIYLRAIERVAGKKIQTEWRCNTTLFQGAPTCGCDGAKAKEVHEVEFAQMMVRSPGPLPLNKDARDDFLKNYLVNANQELWLGPGHAIHTMWQSDRIDYIRDMETIEPIESAILQHRQLEAIDHRSVKLSVRDKDLFSAQHQLVTGLHEYGRNLMPDINSPGVVEGLAARLRTPELYSRLNDRVKVLESVVNTRFARRQSRRSLAISVIGLGIVLILLLPRIDELISKLAALSPTAPLIERLRDLAGGADQTTVSIYVAAIALAVLSLTILSMPSPNLRSVIMRIRRIHLPWRKRSFGYSTKHNISVTRADSEQNSSIG